MKRAIWAVVFGCLVLFSLAAQGQVLCPGGYISWDKACPANGSLASTRNPSVFGRNVTFALAGSTISTSVDFTDNGIAIPGCTGVPVSPGSVAQCTVSTLTVGAHTINTNPVIADEPLLQTISIQTCHVKHGAQGSDDGSTWVNAYPNLQSALGNPDCKIVWVASGVYTPDDSGDVSKTFAIGPHTAVYGGFAGTETERDQRDARVNPTVLSGYLGGGANSYHVVWIDGTSAAGTIESDTVLDGFTITGGNANGNGRDGSGGGLSCVGDGTGHGCNPTLSNLRFTGNRARFGGAMLLEGSNGGDSSPTITNVTFDNNTAASNGGAVYNSGYAGHSSPTYGNVTFYNNEASGTYAGSGFGGAAFNDARNDGHSNPFFVHATFSGNSATAGAGGGAIYTMCGPAPNLSYPWLFDSIAWGDTAVAAPNEFGSDCGVYSGKVSHGVVEGGCPTGGSCDTVLSTSPLLGPLQDNGGLAPTMLPGSSGSAIDHAATLVSDGSYLCEHAPYSLDQRGVPRPQLGACDLGAVELTDGIFGNGFE